MSNVAINVVRESDLAPAGLRLVALILADAAGRDDGGSLFLSMQSIANRCAMSKAQARRHVQTLEDQGLLSISRHGFGPQDTNDYQLHLAAFQQRRAPWAIASAQRRARRRRGTGVAHDTSAGVTSTDASTADARGPLPSTQLDPSHPCKGSSSTHATQSQGIPPTPREGGNTLGRNRTPPARRAGAVAPADTGRSRARNPAAAKVNWNAPRDRDWLGVLS